ncbi:hypothetical protein L1280_003115 [Deinococcus sp. HSC-46F16]|nr:hypothetical protein [Deinococcus sp. HSC-46F16]
MTDSDLDVLFRQSARYRPKWDAQHGGQTYGQRTLEAARRIKGQGG